MLTQRRGKRGQGESRGNEGGRTAAHSQVGPGWALARATHGEGLILERRNREGRTDRGVRRGRRDRGRGGRKGGRRGGARR